MNKTKKRQFLIIILVLLSFILNAVSAYYIQYQKNIDYFYNGLVTDNVTHLNIKSSDFINWSDVLGDKNVKIMIEHKNILDESKKNITLKGIYSPSSLSLPTSKGRSFKKEDYYSNKRVAVLGNHFADETYGRDDKTYIKLYGKEYEVIGWLSNYGGLLDNILLINLDAFEKDIVKASKGLYTIDGKDSGEVFLTIKEKIPQSLLAVKNISINKSSIRDFIKPNSFSEVLIILMTVLIQIITCMSILFWLNSKKEELTLKSAIGIKKRILFKENLKILMFIQITAALAVLLVSNIIVAISIKSFLYDFNMLYLRKMLISFLLFFILYHFIFYKIIFKNIKSEQGWQ